MAPPLELLAATGVVVGRIDQFVGHAGLGSRRKRLPAHHGDLVTGTTTPGANLLVLTGPRGWSAGTDSLWHLTHLRQDALRGSDRPHPPQLALTRKLSVD
jgi:hypothetical protein